ncbi:MAG: DUF2200 domain-containing protein [Parabacteroides sp.]
MDNEKVYAMTLAKVYPLLLQKVERKGRSQEELDALIQWLTGYSPSDLPQMIQAGTTYGDFFRQAPALNPHRKQIKGKICGIRVEEIEEPLMQEIRYLDKLVDELAKGKCVEKIVNSLQAR